MAVVRDRRDGVCVIGARALRLGVAVASLVVTGLLAASALATSRSEKGLPALNRRVLAAVNSFRAAHGLVRLRESAALDHSARQHSLEMGRVGYFAHPSADGTPFWRRIRHYYGAGDYGYWSVGENLVWRARSLGAGEAMKLWIGSPPHLENLLTPQWRRLGVSAVRVAHAPGTFGGSAAIIITTDFGVRR
jgi:uncharacterized protein YkwD